MFSLLVNPTYQTRDCNLSSCKLTLQGMFSTWFCNFIRMGSAEGGWQVSSVGNGCGSCIDIARVLIWTCSLLSCQFLCLPLHSIFLNVAPRATPALAEYHVKAPSTSTDGRIGGNVPSETLKSACGMTNLGLVSLSGVWKEKSAWWELIALRRGAELWKFLEVTVSIDLQGSIGFTTLIEDQWIWGEFWNQFRLFQGGTLFLWNGVVQPCSVDVGDSHGEQDWPNRGTIGMWGHVRAPWPTGK